ncbi:MAG: hypothetical protein ACLFR0_09575 [Alphaproteobacteria bacterium]
MPQTQQEIDYERQIRLAEHSRIKRELKIKPIAQVFQEEAERFITKEKNLDMSHSYAQELRGDIIRQYERGHYRSCQDAASAPYMNRTPEDVALGNILYINKKLQETSRPPSITELFRDSAQEALKTLPATDTSLVSAERRNKLVQKFEDAFYTKIAKQDTPEKREEPIKIARDAIESTLAHPHWYQGLD